MGRTETGRGRPRGGAERARGRQEEEHPLDTAKLPAGLEGLVGYLCARGYMTPLLEELGDRVVAVHGRLVLARPGTDPVSSGTDPVWAAEAVWAQNRWMRPVLLEVDSVGDAAQKLRGMQRNWAPYPVHLFRRCALVQGKLPHVSGRPLRFPEPAPVAPLGSYTLLDKHLLLASAHCSSPFPNGEARFVEDREGPASRAYLKLWEALTVLGTMPGPGDRCLDLGAAPGGWTWVLARLGASVQAVDKAPLAPHIALMPGVEVRQASAFGLEPAQAGAVDWWFSDLACYPERLLRLVRRWLDGGTVRRFVCTIKFQGDTDHDTVREFAAIPGSRLMHLHHNKHELTWIRL